MYHALEQLVWLTQLGLSMLLPLVAFMAGCWWAVEQWGWPAWIFIPAILLGIAVGFSTLMRFGRMMQNEESQNKRVGFNRHI